MTATANPNPCPAGGTFTIDVVGGTAPYQYTVGLSPPNPPGLTLTLGPPVVVSVPPSTPPGTLVQVLVSDSSVPMETSVAATLVL